MRLILRSTNNTTPLGLPEWFIGFCTSRKDRNLVQQPVNHSRKGSGVLLEVLNHFLKTIAGAVAVLCTFVPGRANADQWVPFADIRAVNVTGPYYVTVALDPQYTIKGLHGSDTRKRSPINASLLKEPNTITAERWGEEVRFNVKFVSPPVPEASVGIGPVQIRVAKRAVDKPAMRPALAWFPNAPAKYLAVDREIPVDEGDLICSEWTLPAPPEYILVSATGLGVVCVGVQRESVDVLQDDYAVAILPANGKKERRLKLRDVLNDDEAKLMLAEHSIGTSDPPLLLWLQAAWLDEVHRRVFISLNPTGSGTKRLIKIKMIDLDTGSVKQATPDEVLACVVPENGQSLYAAIDMAVQLKGKACREPLKAVLQSPRVPLGARMQSALYLRQLGDSSGAGLIEETESRAQAAVKNDSQLEMRILYTLDVCITKTGVDPTIDEMYAFFCALKGLPKYFIVQ